MQIAEIIFMSVLTMAVSGGVGFLIGRNRKIGGVLSFVLGALLGWIGWIVADISPNIDNSSTTLNTRGSAFELVLCWILLALGLIAFPLGITAMGNGAGVTYLLYVILGATLCGLGGIIMKKH